MLKSTTPILPELDRNVQVLMPVQVSIFRSYYCYFFLQRQLKAGFYVLLF